MLDFDELFYQWLVGHDGSDLCLSVSGENRGEWDEKVIHASDLGVCPRQVALRLAGQPKSNPPRERVWRKERMFYQSHIEEDLFALVLEWHGILKAKQIPLDDEDTSARADFLVDLEGYGLAAGERLLEFKWVNPQLITRERALPKLPHVLQAVRYDKVKEPPQNPVILYWPAGGRAPSRWFEIAPDLYEDEYRDAMTVLAALPGMVAAGEFPPKMPREAKKFGRKPNVELKMVRHWMCSWEWCDYCIDPKHPDRGGSCLPLPDEEGVNQIKVADWKVSEARPEGAWLTTRKGAGYIDDIRAFMAEEAKAEARRATEAIRKIAHQAELDYEEESP